MSLSTKAKGVSASSFLDLKAEVSKQEESFSKNKAIGKGNYVIGGVKRPDKKPTIWGRKNKGLEARASRDIELEAISKPTLETARIVLERKAEIYEKLRKGKTGGLTDKQYNSLLVDFDAKADNYESDSDDVDESLVVPRPPSTLQDDPIVEYEDEFGRIRTGRRSEVPRALAHPAEGEADDDEDLVIRNPTNHFPVYEPSVERVAEIAAAHAEENNPLNVHYDASTEVRAKGAAFYQFSADEQTRRAQMEELKASREETSKVREESGAKDVRPGEVEGMHNTSTTSRAMEKRKKDIEERRRLIEAKRRKFDQRSEKKNVVESSISSSAPDCTTGLPSSASDPLAALEANFRENGRHKAKTEADEFLASL